MGILAINTLGTSFKISASQDTEYLNKLMGYYNRIAEQIEKSGMLKDKTQIAIMTGIMLCDELYQEKTRNINAENGIFPEPSPSVDPEFEEELERRTLEMINKIDQVL